MESIQRQIVDMDMMIRTARRPLWRQGLVVALGTLGLLGWQPAPLCAADPTVCDTGHTDCNCPGCRSFLQDCEVQPLPQVVTPDQPAEPTTEPTTPAPSAEVAPDAFDLEAAPSDMLAPDTFQPSPSALASSFGGAGGGAGIPSMIGDFFGGGYNYQFVNGATVGTAGGGASISSVS